MLVRAVLSGVVLRQVRGRGWSEPESLRALGGARPARGLRPLGETVVAWCPPTHLPGPLRAASPAPAAVQLDLTVSRPAELVTFRRLLRRWAELHTTADHDADHVVIAVNARISGAPTRPMAGMRRGTSRDRYMT